MSEHIAFGVNGQRDKSFFANGHLCFLDPSAARFHTAFLDCAVIAGEVDNRAHVFAVPEGVSVSAHTNAQIRWRAEGIGPIYLKLQDRVLYRIADVEAYEKQSLRKSTSQPLAAT